MTAEEWEACRDPAPMLDYLRTRASDRKRTLFACACVGRFFHRLTDPRSRRAAEILVRYAEGQATAEELQTAATAAREVTRESSLKEAAADPARIAGRGVVRAAEGGWEAVALYTVVSAAPFTLSDDPERTILRNGDPDRKAAERAILAALIRDLISPFRVVVIDPAWLAWRGGTVVRLAQAAYEERRLPSGLLDDARLGVLADALEEAGCADAAILGHLRSGGEHVRGCVVLDAILGRS